MKTLKKVVYNVVVIAMLGIMFMIFWTIVCGAAQPQNYYDAFQRGYEFSERAQNGTLGNREYRERIQREDEARRQAAELEELSDRIRALENR